MNFARSTQQLPLSRCLGNSFDHVLEGRTLELETTVLVGPISQLIFSLLLHPYTDSPSPKNKNGVYQTVKKIEDTITRFDTTHGRDRQQDGQTDRHRTTAEAALMHSIARQNKQLSCRREARSTLHVIKVYI